METTNPVGPWLVLMPGGLCRTFNTQDEAGEAARKLSSITSDVVHVYEMRFKAITTSTTYTVGAHHDGA